MANKVAIVDYGRGNLFSVQRAVEHVGAAPYLVSSAAEIEAAKILILPGVGAFADGMNALRERGLVEAIQAHAAQGKPLLGICLGMQMLFDSSEEYGASEGLGIISGAVKRLEEASDAEAGLCKIPHVGWTGLQVPEGASDDHWNDTPLQHVAEGTPVYFVHSFTAHPQDEAHRLADAYYFGQRVSAAVKKDNVIGMQYHPEKSGEAGLPMLRHFCAHGG